ncbi:MAG: hypothetical protein AB2693_23410 [Candidatus Thiodiazotropha sp.]
MTNETNEDATETNQDDVPEPDRNNNAPQDEAERTVKVQCQLKKIESSKTS